MDNSYDLDAETTAATPDVETGYEKVSHEGFMKLIRPALSCSNNADNMAILKRSVFLVFSKDYIYFRFPSEQQVSVHRFCFPKHDVLKDTSRPIYSNYKKDGPVPLDFEDKIAWESEWLKEAFRKFDAAQAEFRRARASDAPPPPPLVHAVKLEMSEFNAAHAGLAEATLNDPVDVNNDPGAPSTPCLLLGRSSTLAPALRSPYPDHKIFPNRSTMTMRTCHL